MIYPTEFNNSIVQFRRQCKENEDDILLHKLISSYYLSEKEFSSDGGLKAFRFVGESDFE